MPSIKELKAFNFQGWIEQNKEKFKPPVGNAQVWEDGEMMVTVVGGPNQRRDYHDDPTEEFFYQLKGDISVRLMETPGQPPLEVPIREGEIFLLPKHLRHSPQRKAGSIGFIQANSRCPSSTFTITFSRANGRTWPSGLAHRIGPGSSTPNPGRRRS